MDIHINYLAVLVAAAAYFMIGWFWHTVLFGKLWMKLMKIDKLSKNEQKAMRKKMGMSMALNFVANLVVAYCMAFSVQSGAAFYHVAGVTLGFQTGFWIWLGFVATTQLNGVLWEGKSYLLYAINLGHYLLGFLAVGTILAVWQ